MSSMNESYLLERQKISGIYMSTGYMLLGNILLDERYEHLKKLLEKVKFKQSVVRDMHSYGTATPPAELRKLVDEIKDFLESVFESKLEVASVDMRRYSTGSYTLQHDKQPPQGTDVILFFPLGEWKEDFRGEFTYASDFPVFFFPQRNTVALVRRDESARRFVKRVNFRAGKNAYVALEIVMLEKY